MNPLLNHWKPFASAAPIVVQIGRADTLASAVRESFPDIAITVLPDAASVVQWLAENSHPRVDLALIGEGTQRDALDDLLFPHRVQAALYASHASVSNALAYHLFGFFTADAGGNVSAVPAPQLADATPVLALHQRFLMPAAPPERSGAPGRAIDLPSLFQRLALEPRGMIHVGALQSSEVDLYQRMGFRRVLAIEAHPDAFTNISALTRGREQFFSAFQCVIGEHNGMDIFHASAGGGSLLPPGTNAADSRQLLLGTRRLDYLVSELGLNPADFNAIRIDAHGGESRVLRGAANLLPHIAAISLAISYEPRRPGAPAPEQIDALLAGHEFERIVTATPTPHPQWGDALYLKRPAISMRNLGKWGRFGNQVFEYAFVHIMGRRHRLRVETGAWPGNQLFGASDPLPARQYPQHLESTYALEDSQVARLNARPVNLDVCGVFQYHTAYYAPHRELFQNLLTPVPALKNSLDDALARACGTAKTLVALHLRRGDYGFGLFFIPPNGWYLNWLRELWPTLDAPMLYIATDEPAKTVPDFAGYKPITAADLKLPSFGADYYPDFYVISQAHHAAISNSSFSFSACMMNQRGGTFMRPDLFAGRLIAFDPWNAEPLLHRELGILDYRQVAAGMPVYLQRPTDPQAANAVRSWRLQLAESLSLIKPEQLALVLSMDLWTCYKELRRANLRPIPMVDVEKQMLAKIMNRLNANVNSGDPLAAIGPYIGATLFVAPSGLPKVDLSSLDAQVQAVLAN